MRNRSRNTCPSSTASCRPTDDYFSQVEQQMLAHLGNCSRLASAQLRGPGSLNAGCFLQIQHSTHLKIKISALVECSIWAQTQRYWNFFWGGERCHTSFYTSLIFKSTRRVYKEFLTCSPLKHKCDARLAWIAC